MCVDIHFICDLVTLAVLIITTLSNSFGIKYSVMVSVSYVVDISSAPRLVKPKIIKLVFAASPLSTQH